MTKIIIICEFCEKEPEINEEMSNENWKVTDLKTGCKHCGGKLIMKLV